MSPRWMASAAPGRLVDVGGFRLHLHATGQGGPTVVLDAALGGSSLSWSLVQPALAGVTRVCSYDRAGFGWSDPGPLPRTARRLAGELRTLLARAGESPPFLLVGHSFGGLVMRVFAADYRDEVAGLVLVDPAQPQDWARPAPKEQQKIDKGVQLCQYGAAACRSGIGRAIALLVSVGAVPLARALARVVSRGALSREDEGVLAPVWKLPPEARRPLAGFWTRPAFFEALGSQIASIPVSAAETLEAGRDGFGDLPLVTISSSEPGDYRRRQQDALAACSSRGRHVVARQSGHWIPLDEPETVISAVRQMVEAWRTESAANAGRRSPV